MKTKLLLIALCVSTFLNAQSIEFTSAELTTAEIGSTITVDYKYTVASEGYIYCAINLLDEWTWTAEVVGVELASAVAGTDVTGSFDLTIPEGVTPASDLTGNLNYKINIELKQTPEQSTWLAGAYPATQIDLTETLSNDEFQNVAKFSLFPNPATDFIEIEGLDDTTFSNYTIFNTVGKKVLSSENLMTNKVDVSSLNTGLYFISISYENRVQTLKFIKN